MKRKTGILLTGSALVLAMASGSAQAKTIGYDLGNGSEMYYFMSEGADIQTETEGEAAAGADEASLTEDERQKLEAWYKASMQEAIAYVEKYGISYDAENDCLLYNGQKVRWLIDEQIDGNCQAIHMPEGEIDLYTTRTENYELTGIRVASQAEYDERTRQDELAEKQAYGSRGIVAEGGEDAAYDSVTMYGKPEGGTLYTWTEDAMRVEEDGPAGETYVDTVSEDAAGFWSDTEAERKKRAEYAEAGITQNNNGSLLWNGKTIYFLLDEDGGLHVNNTSETKKEKIYILVKRNEDGSIKEVKQVTSEEVLQEKMKMDE